MIDRRWIIRLAALLFSLPVELARADTPPVIFAAASLNGALEAALGDAGDLPRISYAGSGTLARQVAAGAPADLLILANQRWMDWLENRGMLPNAPVPLMSNRLVVIGARGADALTTPDAPTLLDRLDGGRLAMGQRDAVPAGLYAAEWMQRIGVWESLRAHLAETDNVRAALALVARGEAPLGIVYASDAMAEPRVTVVYEVPGESHAHIVYPAAALTARGADLLAALQTPAAAAALGARGFLPAPAAP